MSRIAPTTARQNLIPGAPFQPAPHRRAEAVRWALARIRERPAYERLRERAREIEDLKAQF